MRLVHLAHFGGPYAGSFIPMLRAVLLAGRRRGYDVQAIFSEVARGRPWLAELKEAELPYRFARVDAPGAIEEILGRPGAGDACILHSHFTGFDLASAQYVRSDPRGAAFWHVHSVHSPGAIAFARNIAKYTILARGVSEFLCVSPSLERDVRRRGAAQKRVRFFPNAIDTDRFAPATPEVRIARREQLGLPADVPVLLHFGRDWSLKGGDVYLEAIARLVAQGRRVAGVTAGSGETGTRRIAAFGLQDYVRVAETTDRVGDLYAAADVLVMPSGAEGMPFAMAEALASGTSVVATKGSGQQYIGEGVDAVRLVLRDSESVASAIESLLDRSQSTVTVDARQAREIMVQRMNLVSWAERLVVLYESER